MGQCVKKIDCPKCGGTHTLQVFADSKGNIDGFCFKCSTYFDQIEGHENMKPEEVEELTQSQEEQLKEVTTYPVVTLSARMLHEKTLAHFGCKVAMSEEDGITPQILYCPFTTDGEIKGYSARCLDPKKFWRVGSTKEAEFFGLQQAIRSGSKTVYVTEGEVDAMTIWQVLKVKNKGTPYEKNGVAVVSLTNGASSAKKGFNKFGAKLKEHFNEIVLVFDQDEAGQKAVKDAQLALPTVKVAKLPHKDANECVLKGSTDALVNAILFKKQEQKRSKSVGIEEYFEKALKPVEYGYPYPWDSLNYLTKGLRMGETSYWGAAPKLGKTEIAHNLTAHFSVNCGLNTYIANLEENNVKATKRVVGKLAQKQFHNPDVPIDKDAFWKAAEHLRGKIRFFDGYQNATWDELRQEIVAVVSLYDVKLVMIDPITNLTNGIDHSTVDTMLRGISQEIATLARDLDIHIMIFCHLKAAISGPPHEEGGRVYAHQFTGSRAMARSCHYMIGLEGNRSEELSEQERNLRTLRLLADREYGMVGKVFLSWDKDTQVFTEVETS